MAWMRALTECLSREIQPDRWMICSGEVMVCLSAREETPTRLPGTPRSKIPPIAASQTQTLSQPANRAGRRVTRGAVTDPLQGADGERILEELEVRGERNKGLCRRQCVTVGVVRSMHRKAERADHGGETHRLSPGGGLVLEPAKPAVELSGIDDRVTELRAETGKDRCEETALDLGHVGDDRAPRERLEQPAHDLIERWRLLE